MSLGEDRLLATPPFVKYVGMELSVDTNRDTLLIRCQDHIEALQREVEQEHLLRQAAETDVRTYRQENSYLESSLQRCKAKLEEKRDQVSRTNSTLDQERRRVEMSQQQLKYVRQQLDDRDTTFQQEKLRLQQIYQGELKLNLEAVALELQSSEGLRKEAEAARAEYKDKADFMQSQLGELKDQAQELLISIQKDKRTWQKVLKGEVERQIAQIEKEAEVMMRLFEDKYAAAQGRLIGANAKLSLLKEKTRSAEALELENKGLSHEIGRLKAEAEEREGALVAAKLELRTLQAEVEEGGKAIAAVRLDLSASQAALIRCQSNKEGAIQTSQDLYESLQEKDSVLRRREERLTAVERELERMKAALQTADNAQAELLSSTKAKFARRMQRQYAKWETEAKRKLDSVKQSYQSRLQDLSEKLQGTEDYLRVEQDSKRLIENSLRLAEAKCSELSERLEKTSRRTSPRSTKQEIDRLYAKHRKDTELLTDEFRRKDEEIERLKKAHQMRISELEMAYNSCRNRLLETSGQRSC
jgi:chromosome segregation ATPase